jgi:hypothetical protein
MRFINSFPKLVKAVSRPRSFSAPLVASDTLARQLRGAAGAAEDGGGEAEWSAGASAAATGVGGKAGRHLATSTVKSSIPKPMAIASSQAFISLAMRSRRTMRCFIRGPV